MHACLSWRVGRVMPYFVHPGAKRFAPEMPGPCPASKANLGTSKLAIAILRSERIAVPATGDEHLAHALRHLLRSERIAIATASRRRAATPSTSTNAFVATGESI